jgi:hypothetical protein
LSRYGSPEQPAELAQTLVAVLGERPRWRAEVFAQLVHLTTATPAEAQSVAAQVWWPTLELLLATVPPHPAPKIMDLVRARLQRAVSAGEPLPPQATAHAASALARLARTKGRDAPLQASDVAAVFRPVRRLSAWSNDDEDA